MRRGAVYDPLGVPDRADHLQVEVLTTARTRHGVDGAPRQRVRPAHDRPGVPRPNGAVGARRWTTDAIYGEFLRSVDRVLAEYSAQTFAVWGREMRPPFDLAAFVAVHTAFLNGSTIRALVDPGTLDRRAVREARLRAVDARGTADRRPTDLDDAWPNSTSCPCAARRGSTSARSASRPARHPRRRSDQPGTLAARHSRRTRRRLRHRASGGRRQVDGCTRSSRPRRHRRPPAAVAGRGPYRRQRRRRPRPI